MTTYVGTFFYDLTGGFRLISLLCATWPVAQATLFYDTRTGSTNDEVLWLTILFFTVVHLLETEKYP
jgi:hypothetical protein